MRTLRLACFLLLLAPVTLASGPHVEHGTIGSPTVPFVDARLDRWRFDVVEGDVIHAHLSWDDEDASLALEVVPPQTSCSNHTCVTTIPAYASCETIENEPFAGTSREIEVVATEAGLTSIFVSGEWAPSPVAYTLVFSVNGEAPEIDFHSDEITTTPHRQHVCRFEDTTA